MTAIIIVLAFYGMSFVLSYLLEYLLWEYGIDPEEYWNEVGDKVETWMMCPFVSPFVFLWMISQIIKEQGD